MVGCDLKFSVTLATGAPQVSVIKVKSRERFTLVLKARSKVSAKQTRLTINGEVSQGPCALGLKLNVL